MWKIAFLAFVCSSVCFASAWRLRRAADEDGYPKDCIPVSDCPENGTCDDCLCGDDEVLAGRLCYKLATESLNVCVVDEQCANISDSSCRDGVCRRQKGFGEACSVASDCDPERNLTCASGSCACKEGTARVGEECLRCEGNGTCGNCSENAEEVNGNCRCKTGFVGDGSNCLKEVGLGEGCVKSEQCLNGTCEGGTCTEASPISIPAAGPVLISSECDRDEDCSVVEHSVCKESICQCREEYFPSEDDSRCLAFATKAGDTCSSEKQCSKIPNSSCIDGKCVAVAAAGVKTRGKNGSNQVAATTTGIIIASVIVSGPQFTNLF